MVFEGEKNSNIYIVSVAAITKVAKGAVCTIFRD